MTYRVVYGETIPVWEQSFATAQKADAFALRCLRRGDIVFSLEKVEPGVTSPHSLFRVNAKLSHAKS